MKQPRTLTECQLQSGIVVVAGLTDATHSTHRNVPYADKYRAYTGIVETPVEHLQRAAEDERLRKAQ